eukprot:scaffold128745_cov36-Tisochrysis_lutea.AAC.3
MAAPRLNERVTLRARPVSEAVVEDVAVALPAEGSWPGDIRFVALVPLVEHVHHHSLLHGGRDGSADGRCNQLRDHDRADCLEHLCVLGRREGEEEEKRDTQRACHPSDAPSRGGRVGGGGRG